MEAQIQSIATTQYNDIVPKVQEMATTHMDIRTFFSYAMCSKETLRQTQTCILLNHQIAHYICDKLTIQMEELYKIEDLSEYSFKEIMIDSKMLGILLKAFPNISNLCLDNAIGLRRIYLPTCLIDSNNVMKLTVRNLAKVGNNDLFRLLRNFPKISELNLLGTQIEECEIEQILASEWRFYSLEKKVPLTTDIVEKIKSEKRISLTKIDLSGVNFVDGKEAQWNRKLHLNSFLFQIVTNSPNLETLILNGCSDFNFHDGILYKFFKNFPLCQGLKNLHLQNTSIDENSIKKIAKNCPNLEFLDLTNCANISDEGCKEFERIRSELYPEKSPVIIKGIFLVSEE